VGLDAMGASLAQAVYAQIVFRNVEAIQELGHEPLKIRLARIYLKNAPLDALALRFQLAADSAALAIFGNIVYNDYADS